MLRFDRLRFALVGMLAIAVFGSWLGCADIIGLDEFDFDATDAGDGGDASSADK